MDQNPPIESLLSCLRTGTPEEKTARMSRLSESDWKSVFEAAMRHGIAPLLYDRLKPFASPCNIPAAVTQKLHGSYLANAARNIKRYRELGQVLTAMESQNIPVIVLKGAHLAELVYGNIALRTMNDIDLLVKKDDLAKAAATMLKLGYSGEAEPYGRVLHHLPTYIRDASTPIEIHWAIADPALPLSIDIDGLWIRSRPVTIAGFPTRALSTEDLLLHLCVHACYHDDLEVGLKPFCDMSAALLHDPADLDWKQIELRARQWKARKGVHLILLLLRGLLRAPVPEQLLGSLKPNDFDDRWEILAREQIDSIGEAVSHARIDSWNREYGSLNMAVMGAPMPVLSKSRVLLKALFPSPTFLSSTDNLPRRWMQISRYYLARLWFLVSKYLPIAWRLVRREKKPPIHDAGGAWKRIELRKWLRE